MLKCLLFIGIPGLFPPLLAPVGLIERWSVSELRASSLGPFLSSVQVQGSCLALVYLILRKLALRRMIPTQAHLSVATQAAKSVVRPFAADC